MEAKAKALDGAAIGLWSSIRWWLMVSKSVGKDKKHGIYGSVFSNKKKKSGDDRPEIKI